MARRDPFFDEPLWYQDAVFYELRVRSFYDSNGDGIGDLEGVTQKLDYLEELGVTALWLLPCYPSPMRDDGYDIADYTAIHPDMGTLEDFKAFLKEAHRRHLRVVMELVLNHTSDQHPWFRRARMAPVGSLERDFYVWSDTLDRYPEARIIFKDFELSNWTWDSQAKAYYWHRFYSHQPDLNFENPAVRKAMIGAVDFWFRLGVDGLRLDAVPYLYEREGTNCENLPETYAFLQELRSHVDRKFSGRMLLAEANQWPEDAARYLGPDKCHMAFHFPIMPRLFMGVQMEDRFAILDILAQTPAIDESCQWALFLRNHDELTLEMVTDEERDYMYRVYARDSRARINLGIRRRLAPLMGNNRRKMELLNGLLFSLPGTPVLYYGDELGMGDNIYLGDRDGVRTPMQWSADRNAGFSRANPQQLILPVISDPEYHFETVNAEVQVHNASSLLWWTRRLIALRKQYKAFGRGSIQLLHPENSKVLAFVRRYGNERVLVVANLSRFSQPVELDLSEFKDMVPRELFGQTPFPAIGETPYLLTLGPHGFIWFSLESRPVSGMAVVKVHDPPSLQLEGQPWSGAPEGELREALENVLPDYLRGRRWFGGKARTVRSAELAEALPLGNDSPVSLCLFRLTYDDAEQETYTLPLAFAAGERAAQIRARTPNAVICNLELRVRRREVPGIVYDALADVECCREILRAFEHGRTLRGWHGEATAWLSEPYRGLVDPGLEPRISKAEQSNTSVIFGDRFILKVFRRLDEGPSPELILGRFLTEHGFANAAPLCGAVEYQRGRAEPWTLAVLQGYVPNEGDAWTYTCEELKRYLERALTTSLAPPPAGRPLLDLLGTPLPSAVADLMGLYLDKAALLGRRTAEMHQVLLSAPKDLESFAPEPYNDLYQRSVYQSTRNSIGRTLRLLKQQLKHLPSAIRGQAERVLAQQDRILKKFELFRHRKVTVARQRCHGDFHLGQVLNTGKDFVIIDFEGEPARPLSERVRKRSGLRDVAGMLRSFHYVALSALREQDKSGAIGPRERPILEAWANAWQTWAGREFLRGYLEVAVGPPLIPNGREELRDLLEVFLLEKAVYELSYELNNRPDWVDIPLHGIVEILGSEAGAPG